jgi:hypothetical protein
MKRQSLRKHERGQSIVLIVFGLIGMLGFTALAIDGGMVYSDRRHAQNAADQGALGGALAYIQAIPANKTSAGMTAATNSVISNGYTHNVNGDVVTVTITTPPPGTFWDQIPEDRLVTVTISHETETSFIQMFYGGDLINTVQAVARAKATAPPFDGSAIVSLGNCSEDGGLAQNIGYTGGGNSGGVRAFNGSIFINSTETGAGCGLDPSNNGYGIYSNVGIRSVGQDDYSGEGMIDPNPIQTNVNDGVAVKDPMAGLPEPTCVDAATESGGLWSPGVSGTGTITGDNIADATLAPGIYCVTGEIKATGNETLIGDGVLLVLVNSGIEFTGNGSLLISAPTTANCLGTEGLTTSSCTYKGIVIWVKRTNSSTLEIGGNGDYRITGLVYAPNSAIDAHGGGNNPDDAIFQGQLIVKQIFNNGNGSADVNYVEGEIYKLPPQIDLIH